LSCVGRIRGKSRSATAKIALGGIDQVVNIDGVTVTKAAAVSTAS
jgi:hypothetical protein